MFTIHDPEREAQLVAERGEHYRFQMYSRAGNDALASAIASVIEQIQAGYLTRRQLPTVLRRVRDNVASDGYEEVHDTEPEEAIVDEINHECERQGWQPITRDDLFGAAT